jgi:hypothetical protein
MSGPEPIYRDQARVNPKHAKKIFEIEDIVAKNKNLLAQGKSSNISSNSDQLNQSVMDELSEKSEKESNGSKIKIETSNNDQNKSYNYQDVLTTSPNKGRDGATGVGITLSIDSSTHHNSFIQQASSKPMSVEKKHDISLPKISLKLDIHDKKSNKLLIHEVN